MSDDTTKPKTKKKAAPAKTKAASATKAKTAKKAPAAAKKATSATKAKTTKKAPAAAKKAESSAKAKTSTAKAASKASKPAQELVLLTGITGFIGIHVAKQLLDRGFKVRGSLRSMSRADEVRRGLKGAGSNIDDLEFVELDLDKDEGWEAAVAGCSYVQHVASPIIPGKPDHPSQLIRPAVEGTRRAVEAAIEAKVKKVVLTSSMAAIAGSNESKTLFTEEDWTDVEKADSAYTKSKTLAERRAWELIKRKPDDCPTVLAVINPSVVVGPLLTDDLGTSNEMVKRFANGGIPFLISRHIGWVDVRDVASAQVEAMVRDEANGERFIISERSLWFSDIADALRQAGYEKAPKTKLPSWLVRLLGKVIPSMGFLAEGLDSTRNTSYDKAGKLLDWKPRNAIESVIETAAQLKARGLV